MIASLQREIHADLKAGGERARRWKPSVNLGDSVLALSPSVSSGLVCKEFRPGANILLLETGDGTVIGADAWAPVWVAEAWSEEVGPGDRVIVVAGDESLIGQVGVAQFVQDWPMVSIDGLGFYKVYSWAVLP